MRSHKEVGLVLTAGIISSGLFLLVFGLGLGFLFMFLPTLPILTLGLSRSDRLALAAMLVGTALTALAGNPQAALLFFCMLGIPAWYITRAALRAYPVGLIITHLTVYACAGVAFLGVYYLKDGGLPALLAGNIRAALAELKDGYSDVIETMATRLSFLIFSITIWLWGGTLYAHTWLVNRVLVQKKLARRPDFALTPFTPPNWMISLLLICALASLIGSPDMRFVGKSTLMSLLLPYFFAGVAEVHARSKNWPSRGFLLFFIYFSAFVLLWPVLLLAGVGLFCHIKHLSGMKTSSKG